MFFLFDKNFLRFVLHFLGMFALCYGASLAIIGLSAPQGLYSPFIDHYFNVIAGLRSLLLWGTKSLLSIFGISTFYPNSLTLQKVNGKGIIMVYSCIGYGVMSFWIAFVYANEGSIIQKIKWIIAGLLLICFINIVRLALVLLSVNSSFNFPFFNHHTWFTIAAYLLIFILIFYYNRRVSFSRNLKKEENSINNISPAENN